MLSQANNNITAGLKSDNSALKINAIAAIGIISAFVFSYFLQHFFVSAATIDFIYALIALTFLFLAIFLEAIFVNDIGSISTILFLEVVALSLPFLQVFLKFLWIGAPLTFAFLVWGAWNAQRELASSMKIRIFKTSKSVLAKSFTAIAVFIAVAFMSATHYEGGLITKNAFLKIIAPTDVIIGYWYPVSVHDRFSDAAEKLIEPQLQKNPAYSELSGEARAAALKQSIAVFKASLVKDYLKTDFNDGDSIADILFNQLNYFTSSASAGGKKVVTLGFALLLFLVIRSFGILFYLPAAFLSVILYEILLASGFAGIILETRSKSVIVLK